MLSNTVCTTAGEIVATGETVRDFRGEDATLLGVSRAPDGPSTGRVLVLYPDDTGPREFFPSVFNLTIQEPAEPTITHSVVKEKVTWVRWDKASLRNRTSHPTVYTVYEHVNHAQPGEAVKMCDTKREALAWIADQGPLEEMAG